MADDDELRFRGRRGRTEGNFRSSRPVTNPMSAEATDFTRLESPYGWLLPLGIVSTLLDSESESAHIFYVSLTIRANTRVSE